MMMMMEMEKFEMWSRDGHKMVKNGACTYGELE